MSADDLVSKREVLRIIDELYPNAQFGRGNENVVVTRMRIAAIATLTARGADTPPLEALVAAAHDAANVMGAYIYPKPDAPPEHPWNVLQRLRAALRAHQNPRLKVDPSTRDTLGDVIHGDAYDCPNPECDASPFSTDSYCRECGTAIDWSPLWEQQT